MPLPTETSFSTGKWSADPVVARLLDGRTRGTSPEVIDSIINSLDTERKASRKYLWALRKAGLWGFDELRSDDILRFTAKEVVEPLYHDVLVQNNLLINGEQALITYFVETKLPDITSSQAAVLLDRARRQIPFVLGAFDVKLDHIDLPALAVLHGGKGYREDALEILSRGRRNLDPAMLVVQNRDFFRLSQDEVSFLEK